MGERADLIEWIGREILPNEGGVRAFLKRAALSPEDVDEVVQEAYCRMAGLENYRRIENPRAYLYQVVRSILLSQVRRAKVVRFDTVAELDSLGVIDSDLNPEQAVLRKDDLQRLKSLIENLPANIRQVFLLRKIEGLPQKAIAARLNLSERTVEWYATQGLRLLLAEWAKTDKDVRRRLRDEERTEQRDRS